MKRPKFMSRQCTKQHVSLPRLSDCTHDDLAPRFFSENTPTQRLCQGEKAAWSVAVNGLAPQNQLSRPEDGSDNCGIFKACFAGGEKCRARRSADMATVALDNFVQRHKTVQ